MFQETPQAARFMHLSTIYTIGKSACIQLCTAKYYYIIKLFLAVFLYLCRAIILVWVLFLFLVLPSPS